MDPARSPVELDDSWSIGGRPHGGYLLATVVAEVLRHLDHPHPLAVSATYVASPSGGPAEVEVRPLRRGRSVSVATAALWQDGSPRLEVSVTAGRLTGAGTWWSAPGRGAPDLPPPEACEHLPATNALGIRVGVLDHVELRVDAVGNDWRTGQPSGRAELVAWARPLDGPGVGADGIVDPLALLVLADVMPPVTFDLGLYGWVPTLELSVFLRALPAPGWLRVVQRAHLLRDGWVDEDCEVWDSTGALVVQARQLAAIRVPDGASPPVPAV